MENGNKERVRMDSKHMGNEGRERRREKNGEQGMEKWRRVRIQKETDRVEEETRTRRKATEGGEAPGRRKWRRGEYTRFCRDTNIGMWEEIWRRAGEKNDNTKRGWMTQLAYFSRVLEY